MALSNQDAVELWEDHVGDSGEAPTDDELTDFANAVAAKVLGDAATAWTAHQKAHMGKGTVQQIAPWLLERAKGE